MNVNNVNPSALFGGTWEKIEGKFLLSSSNSHATGTIGGAETFSYTPAGTVGGHSLTVEELAIHYHNISSMKTTPINQGTGESTMVYASGTFSDRTRSDNAYDGASPSQQTATGKAHSHGFTGTAATINKMPPYLTVNVWKRTA
jgi:microcystin-dependent protein